MSTAAILDIVIIAILLVFSAFFSMCDMAYSTVNINRLKKSKAKTAKLALKYASEYEKSITTLLFSNAFVNVVASSIGALFAINIVNDFNIDPTYGGLTSTLVSLGMLLLILTFGEILPKAFAKAHSYGVSLFGAPVVKFFSIVFFPIVFPSTWFAKTITKPIIEKFDDDLPPGDEELSIMVEAIEKEGIIDEDNAEMLHSALEFKDTAAYEIMTPRMRIEGIERKTDLIRFVQGGGKFKHSRVPVYENDLDHIVGYIPVKSLYKAMLFEKKVTVDSLLTEVLEVPRTAEISSILEEMKKVHRHIAVVKDEYGGTDGILTLEDIIEELVGELYDESETVKVDIAKTQKRNQFLVLGSCNIDLFFETFHIDEEEREEGYETLSGFINERLGDFAKVGDEVVLLKVDIKVTKASPYVVEEALITYHPRRKKIN